MVSAVEFIVKSLVNHPDDVEVTRIDDKNFVTIKIFVNKEDLGKVIGKNGKIANAIRTLTRALGRHENKHVNVKIGE